MAHHPRIVLFETSGLIPTLAEFTDKHQGHPPDALERLIQPGSHGKAPVDRIVIPEHVVYEITGLLPVCFPEMLKKFEQAAHDPKQLQSVVEMYVLSSPRGGNDTSGDQKSHIRTLLNFLARHPDCLMSTEASRAYCKRLLADYNGLSRNGNTQESYCPTFRDAFEHMGDAFSTGELRVHIGQLRMMGLINERDYNERLDHVATPNDKQKRFLLREDMMKRLGRSAPPHGEPLLPAELVSTIHTDETSHTDKYLTVDFFRRHPQILSIAMSHYGKLPEDVAQDSGEKLLREALGPSRLMIEHYLHSGLLPRDQETLLVLAKTLGCDTKGFHAGGDPDELNQHLLKQGFFEMTPDLSTLRVMEEALNKAHINAPRLTQFIKKLPEASKQLQQEFRASTDPKGKNFPYEKVYSDALVNGKIGWEQFWELAKQTGGLTTRYGPNTMGTRTGDVLVEPGNGLATTYILLDQSGFSSRFGTTDPGFVHASGTTREVNGRTHHYVRISAEELLERCHAGRTHPERRTKLYRAFEAMLYVPAVRDAVRLRNAAVDTLGEYETVQIEKDFSNRHARKRALAEPPYRDQFTSMHIQSRLMRKNLGEIATLEAAAELLESDAQAKVWLVNNDSDLFPKGGNILLEDGVVRQHAGLVSGLRTLNDRVANQPRLQMVPTMQFMDDLFRLNGRAPRGNYASIAAKQIISEHRSSSWAGEVSTPIASGHYR